MHAPLPTSDKGSGRDCVSIYRSQPRPGELLFTVSYYLPGKHARLRENFSDEGKAAARKAELETVVAKARVVEQQELKEAGKLALRLDPVGVVYRGGSRGF